VPEALMHKVRMAAAGVVFVIRLPSTAEAPELTAMRLALGAAKAEVPTTNVASAREILDSCM